MRKQILTAIGVLLIGSTAAFASPQWQQRSNFNDQRGNRAQQQQQQPLNLRNAPPAQYAQYRNGSEQQISNLLRKQNEARYVKNQAKQHRKAPRFNSDYSRQGRR
jgi:hypothetical protein